MSELSCPVSGSIGGGRCPASGNSRASRVGPRGCSFSGFTQPGDLHAAFDIPRGVDVEDWLRSRERRAINEIIYSEHPGSEQIKDVTIKNVDDLVAKDQDLLAAALGAPARQVILRAEEIGVRTGWKDGYLSTEHGFCPPDYNEAAGALAACPGRVWSDLCERMPGCVSRGRVRESVAALPVVPGTPDVIPDRALWAALVALGMLCSIYRYEDKNDGSDGVTVGGHASTKPNAEMGDLLCEELVGIPLSISLPYFQVSRRMGRAIPHLTFFDQASYNLKVRDPTSIYPYVGRFDNTDLRWPMFGERSEIAFLKGCADTAASFQHGPDAIAACQEHVMNRNIEGLLKEMIRLKEILERMPNAFHSISTNPNSGENYVSATEWVRWGKFSAPLSKRCPAASGLQFPPYLLMDAFLGRKKYDSFLGAEGVHLRAWLPSNLRAFIASIEYHYRIPEFVAQSGDPRLKGVMDGIIEAYTGERGFMGTHRYKVFGILEVASKTGRTETNGNSGGADTSGRPWEEVHKQFSDAMKERLEPFRGNIPVEPHEMRGSFEECRYKSRIISRSFVDSDPNRCLALVTLDIHNTGITFQPGDRLAVLPLNSWEECAKVAAALGLDTVLNTSVSLDRKWARFAEHLASVSASGPHGSTLASASPPSLMVKDILRRGHLAPLTKDLVLKIHAMLRASSNTVLQVLATQEWPVRGTLGDLLQSAVLDTPPYIWDQAFDLCGNLPWLADLIPVEVPRTYSISNCPDELLPSTIDLTISRAEYRLCATFAGNVDVARAGVGSGFLNPHVASPDNFVSAENEVLVGISRPLNFQLPIDGAAPCAYFAGGSGIAPFRSFWQSRIGKDVGRNILYLGVQSRNKFCYEEELRHYVKAGLMEVHLAFSRDSKGLAYDPVIRDLVEKQTEPRYIDNLIIEQGAAVCDLVMSKKQGGLGGYLYVCGSVSVFDSVISGIRKAIYHHRTATMESTDLILNTAFAERRFMLDVFMTPKPLPCNLPTIPLSQLAVNTGHRPGGRMWISVHGSVYDVTDFTPMHPGGTLIIKSNAGVDCSKSFDNLAHTNNPEVASLLTKYFVGHLAPKPEFHGAEELGGLYDLWSDYLRTTVETLVAQQFEMEEILGSSSLWYQGNMLNIIGVRTFYQYQSRLLQGGFSALFGAKFQELVLKLSFALANAAGPGANTRLPDVLGTIARAKTSRDAVTTTKEVSLIGKLICNSEAARHHERGLYAFANRAVQMDMDLLEDIRQEACTGMDAFDTISNQESHSDMTRVTILSTFLMAILEKMAKRLEVFYSKLAELSIDHPELENNPASARWNLVRRRVRDGSFFVLTHTVVIGAEPAFVSKPGINNTVDFDRVFSQVQHTMSTQHGVPLGKAARDQSHNRPSMSLNERHSVRTQELPNGFSAFESHEHNSAMQRMSTFIDNNMRSIRRLSRMPTMPMSIDNLAQINSQFLLAQGMPTPPSRSRPSTPFSSNALHIHGVDARPSRAQSLVDEAISQPKLNRRVTGGSRDGSLSSIPSTHTPQAPHVHHHHHYHPQPAHLPPSPAQTPPPLDAGGAIQSATSQLKLNMRTRPGMVPPSPAPAPSVDERATRHAASASTGSVAWPASRARTSTTSLRSFKLRDMVAQGGRRVEPTF